MTHEHLQSRVSVSLVSDIYIWQVLIGCDGVHSVVAQWLGLKAPIHSGRMAVRGLAVYPQGHGFKHQVQQQFVHDGLRAGFAALNSTDVYWGITHKSCVKGMFSLISFHRLSHNLSLPSMVCESGVPLSFHR